MNRQLLCTFSNSKIYNNQIKRIGEFYNLYSKSIFIFCNEKNIQDLYITYNIVTKNEKYDRLQNTISVHRKKQTNTLYTLNAMNKLIAEENNGVFDKDFQLNWDLYKNCLILTGEVSVNIVPIKLFSIVNIN